MAAIGKWARMTLELHIIRGRMRLTFFTTLLPPLVPSLFFRCRCFAKFFRFQGSRRARRARYTVYISEYYSRAVEGRERERKFSGFNKDGKRARVLHPEVGVCAAAAAAGSQRR